MSRRDARRERAVAVELFNEVWRLLEKPRRSKADADRMIHAAHASRHHWGEVGTPVNVAIGEWQVSHVYAVLRRAEPATYHAKRCLALCREHRIGDFPLAFACEALARADALAGRRADFRRHLAAAERAGRRIAEAEDREEFFRQLRALTRKR